MTFTTAGASLVATLAVASALLAGLTIWLLLTDPATIAGAVQDSSLTPLVRELALAFVSALRSLSRFL
jgi:hypothetical protein